MDINGKQKVDRYVTCAKQVRDGLYIAIKGIDQFNIENKRWMDFT